jgi:hypothetical protein
MDEFVKALVSHDKSPLIPEEENLYGCFVGEWDFDWFDNLDAPTPRHIKGEWIFRWILEGLAIQDLFICPSRETRNITTQSDAAYGTTVRMYNPKRKIWDILYTEWGGATCLEAHREDGKIIQVAVNKENLRWVFSEIAPNSFRWQRMVKENGGNWVVVAYLLARRK